MNKVYLTYRDFIVDVGTLSSKLDVDKSSTMYNHSFFTKDGLQHFGGHPYGMLAEMNRVLGTDINVMASDIGLISIVISYNTFEVIEDKVVDVPKVEKVEDKKETTEGGLVEEVKEVKTRKNAKQVK